MAANANEALLDALIRHQTYLLRYGAYVRNRIWAILDKSEPKIAQLIRDKLARAQGLSRPIDVQRMEALLAAVERMRGVAWKDANAWLYGQMQDLSYQEPIQLSSIVQTVLPVEVATVLPAPRLLRSIALSKPFEGRILKEWAESMEREDIRRIHAQIQLGMLNGESNDVIARRVVGTGELLGRDGVTELTRRQVTAITRTAVNHVANRARDAFMQENAEVIESEVFVATLDSRTTPVCKANDGKRFPLGAGPRPPLHWQCRSLRVATFDGEMVGKRPMKPTTEKMLLREYAEQNELGKITSRDALPKGHKGAFDEFARKRTRELIGRVPAATSYQKWLEQQSKEFQEDTLGKTKAKLFRDGGLTLDKFVAASGTELTLAELAKKHAQAFVAAGLDPKAFN